MTREVWNDRRGHLNLSVRTALYAMLRRARDVSLMTSLIKD